MKSAVSLVEDRNPGDVRGQQIGGALQPSKGAADRAARAPGPGWSCRYRARPRAAGVPDTAPPRRPAGIVPRLPTMCRSTLSHSRSATDLTSDAATGIDPAIFLVALVRSPITLRATSPAAMCVPSPRGAESVLPFASTETFAAEARRGADDDRGMSLDRRCPQCAFVSRQLGQATPCPPPHVSLAPHPDADLGRVEDARPHADAEPLSDYDEPYALSRSAASHRGSAGPFSVRQYVRLQLLKSLLCAWTRIRRRSTGPSDRPVKPRRSGADDRSVRHACRRAAVRPVR